MIHFKNVTKIFKPDLLTQAFTALDQVEFLVPEGSMVGFLGANGAGKTTSLKIIMDFIRPTSGEVTFSKSLGTSKLDIFKNIGFLPERPYFYPNLTGQDFLLFMGSLSDMPNPQIKTEIERWAPRFKVSHALTRELKTYSKGMLQRIGFMATVIHHPKLIILDEPLSGLDPIGRKELKDVIVEVHKEGKTVFFSSHIVPDIEEICDRVIFLKDGKLIYDGAVNSLLVNDRDKDYVIILQHEDSVRIRTPIKKRTELPDKLIKYTVSFENKDTLLSEALAQQANVYSLEMTKPSLEEIFYKTQDK
ncbi:MAG TPA: ABC transporter ATP-binding protein [Bacteriovoracaceae bacterium]|nr:ABC transporter ATP-binding protein [Bacteriovoracaceae bacterium]